MGVVKSYSHFCFKEGLILEEIWKDVTPQHCHRIAKGRKNVKPPFVQKSIVCDGMIYSSLREFCQQHNNMNPPTVWRWLNRVTKIPKEWQERGLKYYD